MSIREVFADEPARKREQSDIVGRFRAGRLLGKRPVALDHWRVTSDDPLVLETLIEEFGGSDVVEYDPEGKEGFETDLDVDAVEILIPSPKMLRTEMRLYGRKTILRQCDGAKQRDGQPCACPRDLRERKEAASNGVGCEPSISLLFQLTEFPDLGLWRYETGSWSMARDIGDIESALAAINGPAIGILRLEEVSWTDKTTGKNKSFHKAVISDLRPAPEES
ncbi:recombination directionality factor [Crossiella sp. CA198]|uniref:recombination directionality factor n=1 Tax=Crossiella sp. CA198 TaxID=3455607 RepID=UPI003F8CFBEA